MRRAGSTGIGVLLGALAIVSLQVPAGAQQNGQGTSFKTSLVGWEEPPSVSSTGSGTFTLKIAPDDESLDYELSFQDLEGDVVQAHVHIAQPGVNGGIAFWLCGTDGTPGPANTPRCGGPKAGGASGTVMAANIIGPNGQFIAPGELGEVLRAIRDGYAYANVHSTRNPGGEIRGQIGVGR